MVPAEPGHVNPRGRGCPDGPTSRPGADPAPAHGPTRLHRRGGSLGAVAHELGISDTTARQHLSGLYRRTGCLNAAQAAF